SFAMDQSNLMLSTNLNAVNAQLQNSVRHRSDLKKMAAKLALSHGLQNATREQAMADRTMRHALKMYQRISVHLRKDANIHVPPPQVVFDGRHAEIRIEKDPRWDASTHHLPSGVKYPCLGCRLHFNEEGHFLGVQAGPMWLTAPSISTQIESVIPGGATLDQL